MGFGLPFLGGFSSAATQSQTQGQQNELMRALQIYRLKRDLENDDLRRAYMLSRLNKSTPRGAGIQGTDAKGQPEVWYPATGDISTPPSGFKFKTTAKQQSPFTKSWETFLASQSLTDDTFSKLAPPQKMQLYQQYRTTLSPDLQLKDELLRAHLAQVGLSNDLTMKLAPKLLDMINKESASPDSSGTAATAASIIPGVSGFDPSDPSTFGAD